VITEARKILVYGIDGLKPVKLDSGEILFADKDFEGHLAEFDIIIYCVGAFKHTFEQGVFFQPVLKNVPSMAIRRENEIGLALERGRTVCIVGPHAEDYVVSGVFKSYKVYYGEIQRGEVFRNLQVRRSEFKSFVDDVGATEIGFNKDSIDDVICLAGDIVTGFSKKVENGLLLFIPCIWGSRDPGYFVNHLEKLVAGIIAYSTKLLAEPPSYIEQFQFAKENVAREEIEKITREQIVPLQRDLGFYHKMKSVLWLGNKALENVMEDFLKNMGFQTHIDMHTGELFEEDLWIIKGSERLVIVEIKGLNKNLTRQDLSKLDEHREAREVPNITGLLIANTFMAADSFENKDLPFPPNVIEKAVHSNLVITRSIDLCRIFDCFENRSAEKLLEVILGQKGWLTFQNGKIQLIS
jgi:hypothetical protein